MKKMIVLTDFSAASHNATLYAVSLAKEFEAEVTLLNVTPPSVIVHDSMFASVMITQAEILQQNSDLMDKAVSGLSTSTGPKINGVTKEGYVYDVLLEMMAEESTDLVIMGMKGKGQSHSVFGSTTTAIIRKAAFPVLIVPGEARYECIERITYASDFNTTLEMSKFAALEKLARQFSAPVMILHVETNDRLTPGEALGKMKTSVQFSRLQPEFHSIREKDVVTGINKFMDENPCSLLTMVAHKHSLFERIFGKVLTKEMSLQTKIPLLVLQAT